MIFKIKFENKTEYAQAKDMGDLLQSYQEEYGDDVKEIKSVSEISEAQAKKIKLKNTDLSTYDECPEFSLYDTVSGDDFIIVGSTEWD